MFLLPWASTVRADDAIQDQTYPSLNQLASRMVGEQITVHCLDINPDWTGFTTPIIDGNGVQTFNPDIYLQKYICYGLRELMNYISRHYLRNTTWQSDKEWRMGEAILTLVHESGHIKLNSIDEGVVECWAVHHVAYYLSWFNLPAKVERNTLADARENHHLAPAPYQAIC